MKNLYAQQKNRHQKEMNAFPLGACFSNEQFDQMMRNWGLTPDDTDKICSVGGGCYIRKSDSTTFREMLDRFVKEREEAIAADKTGDGFIYHQTISRRTRKRYSCRKDQQRCSDTKGREKPAQQKIAGRLYRIFRTGSAKARGKRSARGLYPGLRRVRLGDPLF